MTIAGSSIDSFAATAMQAAVHRGGVEVIERWADDWRRLCSESPDDQPFYRPEWIAAHIRAFTPGAKVVLLTVSSAGKLLFVLPLLREWTIFSGIPCRRLRAPVNSHSCRFDAVRHASSQGDAAVVAAANYLQSLHGWDFLELSDAPEGGTIFALSDAARDAGFHTGQLSMRRNPYVPVPPDSEGLKKLPVNARLRGKLRHIRREVDSQGGLKFLRVNRADPSFLERFYLLEAAGWKGTEGSAIACNPNIRQFYDEIARTAEQFGYLCMYSLEFNGELLASHLGLAHNGRYFSPKIAYNEKFPQYAPGHLIVSEIMQDCAAQGISEYDITGIDDEWKMKWASETRAKFIHFIFNKNVLGGLAYALRFQVRPAVKKLIRR
jgi:CelD/BcsL family acetyltransferase involved in cellulose biosynthesis